MKRLSPDHNNQLELCSPADLVNQDKHTKIDSFLKKKCERIIPYTLTPVNVRSSNNILNNVLKDIF